MAGPIPTKTIAQLTDYGAPLNGNELFELWVVNTSRRVVSRKFVLPIDSLLTLVGQGADLPGSRQLVSSASVEVVDNGAGSTVQLNAVSVVASPTGVQTFVAPAGTTTQIALNASIGFLDIDTTAGAAVIRSIVVDPLSTFVIVTNTGPNLLTLNAMDGTGGVNPAARLRLPVDLTLIANDSKAFRYSNTLSLWVPL